MRVLARSFMERREANGEDGSKVVDRRYAEEYSLPGRRWFMNNAGH